MPSILPPVAAGVACGMLALCGGSPIWFGPGLWMEMGEVIIYIVVYVAVLFGADRLLPHAGFGKSLGLVYGSLVSMRRRKTAIEAQVVQEMDNECVSQRNGGDDIGCA